MRRLTVLLLLGAIGCGGKAPEPASPQLAMQATVNGFLAAVKANDLNRMGQLWGTDKGPATGTMEPTELMQRLTVIQKYLTHSGYRVVEGPISAPGNDRVRTFRVELQRNNCVLVVPLDLVFARNGTWVVFDVHLEAAGNPAVACPPPTGTRP